jgi:hypothetical protein
MNMNTAVGQEPKKKSARRLPQISSVYSVRLDEAVDIAVIGYQKELEEQCLVGLSKGDVLKYLAESRLVSLGRLTDETIRDSGQSRLGGYTTISRLLTLRQRVGELEKTNNSRVKRSRNI